MNLNFLCFNILTLVNIKATVGLLDVAEVFSTVYKDLEPLRVSAPNLHVFGFAWALNIPRLVIQFGSNGQ